MIALYGASRSLERLLPLDFLHGRQNPLPHALSVQAAFLAALLDRAWRRRAGVHVPLSTEHISDHI